MARIDEAPETGWMFASVWEIGQDAVFREGCAAGVEGFEAAVVSAEFVGWAAFQEQNPAGAGHDEVGGEVDAVGGVFLAEVAEVRVRVPEERDLGVLDERPNLAGDGLEVAWVEW